MKRRDLFTSFMGLIGTAAAVPFLGLNKKPSTSTLELVFKKDVLTPAGEKTQEISSLRSQFLRDGRIASITKETLLENRELKTVLRFNSEEHMQQYLKAHQDILAASKTSLG